MKATLAYTLITTKLAANAAAVYLTVDYALAAPNAATAALTVITGLLVVYGISRLAAELADAIKAR